MKSLLFTILVFCTISNFKLSAAFVAQKSSKHHLVSLSATPDVDSDRDSTIKEDKFSFKQRIESIKTAGVGALSVCFLAVYVVCHMPHMLQSFLHSIFSYF